MARDGTIWPIIDRRSPEAKLERDLWELAEQDGDRWLVLELEPTIVRSVIEDFAFAVKSVLVLDWSFERLINNFKMLQADVTR